MKKLLVLFVLGAFIAGCGGKEKKEEKKEGFEMSRKKKEEKTAETTEGVPVDLNNKGVGPISSVDFADAVDSEMAAKVNKRSKQYVPHVIWQNSV